MHASSADSGATRFPLRPRLLLPRPDARAVMRPRLMRRIAADRVSPVTAIVAPAGFGKTTLAAQWLAERESPSAWITLEPDDDTPARCLYALVAALRRIDPTVGTASLAIIAAEPPPAPDQVGEALADELCRVDAPWTLVIDDAHALADPDTHLLLAGLLRTPLPAGHVLLTSRTPLPPAICQAIGADRLVQLDATDLRFADNETRDLAIAIIGGAPDPATLDRLREVASGWPACSRLLLARLRDAAPGDALAIGQDADVDGVIDWLIARSLDHLPAAVRDALSYEDQRFVERMAPTTLAVPSGRPIPITYEVGAPPRAAGKIQWLYGLENTPAVGGGRAPIVLEILGPNMRPLQVTSDLGGFWKTLYPQLRNELRRRYPKHEWR